VPGRAAGVLGCLSWARSFPVLRLGFVLSWLCLALAVTGYAARDRWAGVAVLSYVPLLPIALTSMALAALQSARVRARKALFGVSLIAVIWALPAMVGWGTPRLDHAPLASAVRLLHWNVLWGGPRGFDGMRDTIVAEAPDVVVLSEAPREAPLADLVARLGRGWSMVHVQNPEPANYWYKMVVASRWPVRLLGEQAVDRGRTMLAQIDAPERSLRILVVDGQSDPARDRTKMLRDVAKIVRGEDRAGTPVDVLAGDFNAPGRSLGFDELFQAGYSLAASVSHSWRATWPSFLPLLDLDHVLLRDSIAFDCRFFSNPNSDHRGQVVRLSRRRYGEKGPLARSSR
jgi:endonuclease/exonuclease/phosphatase family metal-dependent hydrolase